MTTKQELNSTTALTTDQVQRHLGNHIQHAACGVAGVGSTTGKPEKYIIPRGLEMLTGLEHRGAEAADGVSGDGAGGMIEVPQKLFRKYLNKSLMEGDRNLTGKNRVGVGMFFLPKESEDKDAHDLGKKIIEEVLNKHGIHTFAWRKPRVDSSVLGVIAAQSEPDTLQIVFQVPGVNSEKERLRNADRTRKLLYDVTLDIEARIVAENNASLNRRFYTNSFSDETLVYKGMMKPSDLSRYHLDLQDFVAMGIRSRFMIVHQRFATNAWPDWKLAHPYRIMAHNGEIDTIAANAPEAEARTQGHVPPGQKAIKTDGSDTAQLDSIFGMQIAHGWDALHAFRHNIPPADHPALDDNLRTYIRATQAITSQADGPAGVILCDGRRLVAGLDRSGLRDLNVVVIPGRVEIASEILPMLPGDGKYLRRALTNGETVAVNLNTGVYLNPEATSKELADLTAHKQWVNGIKTFTARETVTQQNVDRVKRYAATHDWLNLSLSRTLGAVGMLYEDAEHIIPAYAEEGKELIVSMGNTRPLAVMSHLPFVHARFANFLVQRFAQVTNPPIDSVNEAWVFDTLTRLGNRGDIISYNPKKLAPHAKDLDLIELKSPILSVAEFAQLQEEMGYKNWKTQKIDATFEVRKWRDLEARIDEICADTLKAVQEHQGPGSLQIVVSHKAMSESHAMIPSILLVAAIDRELVKWKVRHKANIHAEAADIHDTHSTAMAITSGADTVTPYVTEEVVLRRYANSDPVKAVENYHKGLHTGLMKIMGKMGITTLNSYRGGRFFSAMGLDWEFSKKYLGDDVANPFSGATLKQIAYSIARNHRDSYAQTEPKLRPGSLLRTEMEGDVNAHTSETVRLLQAAVDPRKGSYEAYKLYEKQANRTRYTVAVTPEGKPVQRIQPIFPEDLLAVRPNPGTVPVPKSEVQSRESIQQEHMGIPPMSFGALGRPAIIALNEVGYRLGIKVNCGEGGEEEDLPPHQQSNVKQVASGHFGVTIYYLQRAQEIQFKMAQGAKPGEGGQLPAYKVDKNIARARNSTPGVGLISPPPHHNIYSIEDKTQAGRNMKEANPLAAISSKLVSEAGVGTVAAGVSKCGFEIVHISGNDGGTGAAGFTAVNNTGWPRMPGLAGTQQMMVSNGIRDPYYNKDTTVDLASLSTDGSMRTGRDMIIAAIFGAERMYFGTSALVAGGCKLVRKCQDGSCPVGIATHDAVLQKHFQRDAADRIVNYFDHVADDVRDWLSILGARSLKELRGRVDLLAQLQQQPETREQYSPMIRNIKLDACTHVPKPHPQLAQIRASRAKIPEKTTFDQRVLQEIGPAMKEVAAASGVIEVVRQVNNADLNIGTRVGGEIARMENRKEATPEVHYKTSGQAGQSYGVYIPKQVKMVHRGDVQSFAGEGLSGGSIAVIPSPDALGEYGLAPFVGAGTIGYGATSGDAFFAGRLGNRAGVRNSGATIICEGAAAFAAEYMTNGWFISLGPVGPGSFTGHSGGKGIVYDPRKGRGAEGSTMKTNPATYTPFVMDDQGRQIVRLGSKEQILDEDFTNQLKGHLVRYHAATGSPKAGQLIGNWGTEQGNFWIIIPRDYAAVRLKMFEDRVTGADADLKNVRPEIAAKAVVASAELRGG